MASMMSGFMGGGDSSVLGSKAKQTTTTITQTPTVTPTAGGGAMNVGAGGGAGTVPGWALLLAVGAILLVRR